MHEYCPSMHVQCHLLEHCLRYLIAGPHLCYLDQLVIVVMTIEEGLLSEHHACSTSKIRFSD